MLKEFTFLANSRCFIGGHDIFTGEAVGVHETVDGLYWLWREEDDEPIARLTFEDVNKLAGFDIIPTSATPLTGGDDTPPVPAPKPENYKGDQMSEPNATSFDQYAIVELYGYSKIAGRVTEQTIGGHGFIRIDVPASNGRAGFTRLFGPQSIYSITPVSEEIVLRAIQSLHVSPVTVYLGNDRQLQEPDEIDERNIEMENEK